MELTEKLWQYQQADLAADAYQNEIKRDPKRAAVKKKADFLRQQQDAIRKMEQDMQSRSARVAELTEAIEGAKARLTALEGRSEPADLGSAKSYRQEAQQLLKTLNEYADELKQIIEAARTDEKNEVDIKKKFAKVRTEYDAEKGEYDELYKQQTAVLDEKRAAAAELGKAVAADLMEKYLQIKKHTVPPVARLLGDQCGGCNMSLPQVTLRKFRSDEPYIECENCGRLIIR